MTRIAGLIRSAAEKAISLSASLHIDKYWFLTIVIVVCVLLALVIFRLANRDLFIRLGKHLLGLSRTIASSFHLNVNKIIIAVLALFMFSQFCYLTYTLAQNADSWPIVSATDNDAANAIRVSEIFLAQEQWLCRLWQPVLQYLPHDRPPESSCRRRSVQRYFPAQ